MVGVTRSVAALAITLLSSSPRADASPVSFLDIATEVGKFTAVELSEGLKVHLNTRSRLRARPPQLQSVAMELLTGEVLVEIKPGAMTTLHIGEDVIVSSIGQARLDVRKERFKVAIAVLEGSATVRYGPRRAKTLQLMAGHEAAVGHSPPADAKVKELSLLDLMRRTAWTQQRLWFEAESLREVVNQINHFNQEQIVISDSALASLPIGGVFRPTDVDTFLRALAPIGIRAVKDQDADPVVIHLMADRN